MNYAVIHFVSRVASASGLSVARPWLCLLLIQAAVMVTNQLATDPSVVVDHWLASPWVTAFALAAAIYEWLVEHEDDAEELQRSLYIDRVLRVAASAAMADLLIATDYPDVVGVGLPVAETADAVQAVAHVSQTEAPLWVRASVVGGAIALNLALSTLRAGLLERLGDLGLKGLWQKLETGGVLVALVLLAFFPILVFALLAVATVALGILAVLARQWEKAADHKRRRACPECEHAIRVEALRCPACRGEVEPTMWLKEPGSSA